MVEIIRGFIKWSQDNEPTTDINNNDIWYNPSMNRWNVADLENDKWCSFKEYTTGGDRGVFGGGFATGGIYSNIIDYITISSTGNTTDFGDLTLARYGLTATSNGSHF